jgi:hypothetical protein
MLARPLDFGPEYSRLIGHTGETLDWQIESLNFEGKRIKRMLRKIRQTVETSTQIPTQDRVVA